MSALLSAGPGAPATPPTTTPLPAPSSASSLATLGSRSAFDVLSDGPLEHVLTFLDCKALCVSKVAMRDFLTITAHPRFVTRLKRLRGFDDAPMAPMVDAREHAVTEDLHHPPTLCRGARNLNFVIVLNTYFARST